MSANSIGFDSNLQCRREGLPGRSETSSRCNGGLMAFCAGVHIIHNLVTTYPQDIYAQAAHDRQNIKEFSFDKNRMKCYK